MEILNNEIQLMDSELSKSKASNEILQLKQRRIDRLRKVYNVIQGYNYLDVYSAMEKTMTKLQQLDELIDGFLVEIKFKESLKHAALFTINATNVFNQEKNTYEAV